MNSNKYFLNYEIKMQRKLPKSILNFCKMMAYASPYFFEFISDTQKAYVDVGITKPIPIDQLRRFYLDNKDLEYGFKRIFLLHLIGNQKVFEFANEILKSIAADLGCSIETVLESIFGVNEDLFRKICEEVKTTEFISVKSEIVGDFNIAHKVIREPIIFFIYRIWFPCFLSFGTLPGFLYRKARQGDLQSICNLILIDKSMLRDKRIAEQVYKYSMDPGSKNYRKIINAISGTLSEPSIKTIKMRVAGFISKFASLSGVDMTAPDIQAIFDEAHAQANPDELIDTDLPESKEAFTRDILRKKQFWKI